MFSVHSLKPYIEWNQFEKLILENYTLFNKIIQQPKIERITLRYVNKVNVGNKHNYSNIKEHFHFIPTIPFAFNETVSSIQNVCEFSFADYESVLVTQQITIKPEKDMPAPVIFDISFVKISNNSVFDFKQWLDFAHTQIVTVFDKSFTDIAKNQFKL